MINILYNGRTIYRNITEQEVNQVLLELAENPDVDENEIVIEEV